MTLIRLIRASIGCVILVALAAPVAAQLRETELHGVVRDATGAGVVGATVTLTDSRRPQRTTTTDATGATHRPGLPASGMFLINPPYTLKPLLQAALPQLAERLAQDRHATHSIDSGG